MIYKLTLLLPFFLFFFSSCETKKKFIKLEKAQEKVGLLYIIRPDRLSLSAWDYDVELFKYKSSYAVKEIPDKLARLSLGNANFAKVNLPPGIYKIEVIRKQDTQKVFSIKESEITFLLLEVFSTGRFTPSEFYFQSVSKEKALEELLAVEPFSEVPISFEQMPVE